MALLVKSSNAILLYSKTKHFGGHGWQITSHFLPYSYEILTVFFDTIIALACTPSNNDDFHSPKSLFVDQITAHTAGVISITNPIKLKLEKKWGDSLLGKEIKLLDINFF